MASLCLCVVLLYREVSLLPDGDLWVHVLSVDQGDSILLVTPTGKQVLIDGGPNLQTLEHLGTLMPFFDRTIELLVLTHPDSDHLTALPEILKRYDIEQILLTGIQKNHPRYAYILDLIQGQQIPILIPDPAKDIAFDDGVLLDIIYPEPQVFGTTPKDANNTSVVIRALYGKDSILLTGDIEEEAEKAILASGVDIESGVLKAAHHGSKTSSSTGFILATNPQSVVISSGSGNSFGHPHGEVTDRFGYFGIPYRNTALEGTISLRFTGK